MILTADDQATIRAILKVRRRMEQGTRGDLFAISLEPSQVDTMKLDDATVAKVLRQCMHSFLERDCEDLAKGNIIASHRVEDWARGKGPDPL